VKPALQLGLFFGCCNGDDISRVSLEGRAPFVATHPSSAQCTKKLRNSSAAKARDRRVQVKGRKQEFIIYELLGMAKGNDPEIEIRPQDKKLSEMTWVASKSFEKGDFDEAARRYREILAEFPNDPVAKAMLASCSSSTFPIAVK
jgi:hypothetical protein